MRKWRILCLIICVMLSSACGSAGRTTPASSAPAATASLPNATATPTDAPTATGVPPTAMPTTASTATTAPPPTPIPIAPDADKGYHQWAIAAVASSEYGNLKYSATQATGKPDTLACGAASSAWSPAEADGIAWLELSYDSPTAPTLINVIQTHNPSQIVKIELVGYSDNYTEIYTAQPYAFDECPYTFSIPVLDVRYQFRGLRITVDQALGIGRPAIDGPDDTLFLTGYGGYILELIPADGRVIQRLGQETLADTFPQRLRVDDAGNVFVTTWGTYSAVKLDSQGYGDYRRGSPQRRRHWLATGRMPVPGGDRGHRKRA